MGPMSEHQLDSLIQNSEPGFTEATESAGDTWRAAGAAVKAHSRAAACQGRSAPTSSHRARGASRGGATARPPHSLSISASPLPLPAPQRVVTLDLAGPTVQH